MESRMKKAIPCGHCNDPNRGPRYATKKGWLCEACWSSLVAQEPKPPMKKIVKKVAKKAVPMKKAAPAKKVAPKKKGR